MLYTLVVDDVSVVTTDEEELVVTTTDDVVVITVVVIDSTGDAKDDVIVIEERGGEGEREEEGVGIRESLEVTTMDEKIGEEAVGMAIVSVIDISGTRKLDVPITMSSLELGNVEDAFSATVETDWAWQRVVAVATSVSRSLKRRTCCCIVMTIALWREKRKKYKSRNFTIVSQSQQIHPISLDHVI